VAVGVAALELVAVPVGLADGDALGEGLPLAVSEGVADTEDEADPLG
jgi:hypothetical protein